VSRTVFLGTSAFAVAVLRRLAASPHRPALVVTRPDRPRGRGRKLAAPPAAEAARELGLEVIQPPSANDEAAVEAIAAVAPDAVCVCAYGGLIKEPLLSAYPMLNVHPSLLPRWRGAAPVERAIMAGDVETGVSIMRVVEALDAGPVCAQRVEPIHGDDTYGSLATRLERIGGDLLVEALDDAPPFVDQDEAHATYAEKIGPGDRLLDPADTPAELDRIVRALEPHIGARLPRAGAEPLRVRASAIRPEVTDVPPGALAARDGDLLYGAAGGALQLLVVQPPGGRPMDAEAFLRGHAV
jgi:methionyl-tRNA formyltransferase